MTRRRTPRSSKVARRTGRPVRRTHEAVTVTESASKVRQQFSGALNRVAFRRDRIRLERHGKLVAAMISVEDLELLEALEDRLDLEEARAALAEAGAKGTRPWETIKAALRR